MVNRLSGKDRAMKKMLVTGGTVFVSRYAAEYFAARQWDVYVLNRGSRPQSENVILIEADRRQLGDRLRGMHFDAVLDITAYTSEDVNLLLDGLDDFGDYILLSSSAVYPENAPQPFSEECAVGENAIWGKYGTDKIGAETAMLDRVPEGYILRPPYLYGPMNNVYREAFVFECAMGGRKFYVPGDGSMELQFFHVDDLCRFMEILLSQHPEQRVFNVGNPETVSVDEWVRMCYRVARKEPRIVNVPRDIPQRAYFSFYDYQYYLDVEKQRELLPFVRPLEDGLKDAFEWYCFNADKVVRKPLIEFIDRELTEK